LQASAHAVGRKVTTRTVSDEASGRRQVSDGTLDALVIGDGGQLRVVVKKTIDANLKNDLNVLAGQLALDQQIAKLGGDPQAVNSAVAAAKVSVAPLEPPYQYQPQQLALGLITGILIYMALMLYGQSVAQGVVEEKSSRVVELLLSTVRPWQLMAGKVLGIGVVGLIQMVVLGAGGVIAGLATGALTISITAAAGTVAWLVVWYLLGFFAYALAFAAAGALVSRQEDVNGVVTPILMLVIVGYVLGVSILPSNPSSSLCEVLSIIPVFAPTLMPMRLAMGGVPAWEAALAVVLMVAMIPALVWLSGRVYRNAVMRTGARVKLSEAFRAA
jgi:ABC-2 type transport system permease protein